MQNWSITISFIFNRRFIPRPRELCVKLLSHKVLKVLRYLQLVQFMSKRSSCSLIFYNLSFSNYSTEICFWDCSRCQHWQRAHAVWCLSSKNRLKCFVFVIKSYQHFNSLTFPFLAGPKLHVHGVNSKSRCTQNWSRNWKQVFSYSSKWNGSARKCKNNNIFLCKSRYTLKQLIAFQMVFSFQLLC